MTVSPKAFRDIFNKILSTLNNSYNVQIGIRTNTGMAYTYLMRIARRLWAGAVVAQSIGATISNPAYIGYGDVWMVRLSPASAVQEVRHYAYGPPVYINGQCRVPEICYLDSVNDILYIGPMGLIYVVPVSGQSVTFSAYRAT